MDGVEEQVRATSPESLTYPFPSTPEPGEMLEVADGVFWVRMPLPFALKAINVWVLRDGEGHAIVDTGLGDPGTRSLWERIFGALGRPITRVFCTHLHPDHVGSAGWIADKFGCTLWMSRLEYLMCRMLAADTGQPAPHEGIDFYRAAGWSEEALDRYKARFGGFGRMISPLPQSFVRMSEGGAIDIDGRQWRVVVGSGHSPEHACLWRPEDGVFISGDQVLPRISSNVSVFPTEPEANPLADWITSCERLRGAVPSDVLVLPAHNEPFYGLHTRLSVLVQKHRSALDRIESRLAEPKRALDVFGALFARPIDEGDLGMATGEALAHLNYLVAEGRAVRRTDADGCVRYVRATP